VVWFGRPADLRIYSLITTTLMLGISLIGSSFESRIQLLMLLVLIAAIICFFIGSFIGPQSQSDIDKGFLGYSGVSGATFRCGGRRRLWE
jgi:solute carrier family 12 sodium/potassium/chloride transporter 2